MNYPKVLAVDDSEQNLVLLEGILSNQNIEVITAQSAHEALLLSHRHDFSLFLLDVIMPDMDGFELATQLKRQASTAAIPVLFITASAQTEDFECHGYDVGAIDYIYKPVPADILISKVKVFLNLHEQKEQLRLKKIELEQELKINQQLQEKNQLLLKAVGQGIFGVNAKGLITFVNPAAEELLEAPSHALINQPLMDYLFLTDENTIYYHWHDSPIYKKSLQGERWQQEIGVFWKQKRKTDKQTTHLFPAEYSVTPIFNDNVFDGVVIAFQDISERKKIEDQLQRQAYHDALTGLINRGMFNKILEKALLDTKEYKQESAVLFTDLDRFKQVNDSFGHNIGDTLLVEASKRIQLCIRPNDTLCRLGGDEFVILLNYLPDHSDINLIAQSIIDSINEPFYIQGHEIFIGISIGISLCSQHERTLTSDHKQLDAPSLIKFADTALDRAKNRGRNQFQFFTSKMQQTLDHKLKIERQLHQAVDKQEFRLLYQPQIEMKSGKMIGVEALIRWQLNGEIISPIDFIPIAEETGLIDRIGQWVMQTACWQSKQWQQPIMMSVNLSMRQFFNQNLLSTIEQCLKKYHLKPENLCLELTESLLMENVNRAIGILNTLRAQGVKISIDDFGTGYSSLSYLQRIPIDELKIDRSFVLKIGNSKQGESIIKSIIELSHNLGYKVVAEGVETKEQRDFLNTFDCDIYQGYLFSKPIPAEQLINFMPVKHLP